MKIDEKLFFLNKYIDKIKETAYHDIYNLQNLVLNKNPFTSGFIKKYLFDPYCNNPSMLFKFRKSMLFYFKNSIRFLFYIITLIFYRIKKKSKLMNFDKKLIVIDIFFLVDRIINENKFNENYLIGLYEVLDKYNKNYIFLPRLYGINKNPFKILKLLKVLNNDKNKFIFEFDLLTFSDFVKIVVFIFKYPYNIHKLEQNAVSNIDKLFNYELYNSLPNTSFEAYVRYLIGKRLSNKLQVGSSIYSWQEFQNLEKTFYKSMHESSRDIRIYGCEFLIKYQNYLSMHITNTDVNLSIVPHKTLLNGKYNYSSSEKHIFLNGVSLRYKNIFLFDIDYQRQKNSLVLLTYEIEESNYLLRLLNDVKENIKVKIHPATKENDFILNMNQNRKFVDDNIYSLFKTTQIVFVASMSGTALEAVASGVSVIIIASQDNLTANPLVDYGKGKIWDIAFSEDDVKKMYNKLLEYRKNNKDEIQKIASWYKDNFFIEPTEENIVKAFDLDKDV